MLVEHLVASRRCSTVKHTFNGSWSGLIAQYINITHLAEKAEQLIGRCTRRLARCGCENAVGSYSFYWEWISI